LILFTIKVLKSTSSNALNLLFEGKKKVVYKRDERWQMIQVKANQIANITNWILIILAKKDMFVWRREYDIGK